MPREPANAALYFQRVLVSIVDFLLISGASPNEVRKTIERRLILAKVATSSRVATNRRGRSEDTVSAVVLHRWHREPRLLDGDALPRPLRLYGRSPSVEALVRAEQPGASARDVVSSMRGLGLIRRAKGGRYVPRARVATISTLHPVLIEHVAHSLKRLLETVQSNVSPGGPRRNLIERYTHIPDLRTGQIRAFRDFSQLQGSAFLASVDDWLEARRAKSSASSSDHGVAAGIHVFAYVEKGPSSKRGRVVSTTAATPS
jgi:hypothetical protein